MTDTYKPDGHDLVWLARSYRGAAIKDGTGVASPDFWLDEIRTDFGDDVAARIEAAVAPEVEAYQKIQPVRDAWLVVKRETDALFDALKAEVDQ